MLPIKSCSKTPESQEITVLEYFHLLTYIFIPSDLGIEIPAKEYRGLGFFYSGMVQGYCKRLRRMLVNITDC